MLRQAMTALTLATVIGAASDAYATQIEGTATVNAVSSDPGLVVKTDVLGPISLNLQNNVSQTVDLFRIWTDESYVNLDDIWDSSASVTFTFDVPSPQFGGNVNGTTSGAWRLNWRNPSYGEIGDWDDPLVLGFGPSGDGILEISLSEEVFNEGPYGWSQGSPGQLTPGKQYGANVQAEFLMTQTPSVGQITAVPVPATIGLFGFGLAGLGAVMRYRRT